MGRAGTDFSANHVDSDVTTVAGKGTFRHVFLAAMGMPMKLCLSVLALLLIAACDQPAPNYQAPVYQPAVYQPPPAPAFSPNAASLKLKPWMTEEDVVRTLGLQPTSTNLSTCGTGLKAAPWSCKTMEYGDRSGTLLHIILQQNAAGVWVVNAWSVVG